MLIDSRYVTLSSTYDFPALYHLQLDNFLNKKWKSFIELKWDLYYI